MTTTVETLIGNALTNALAGVNASYANAAAALHDYDTHAAGTVYQSGWSPIQAFATTSGTISESSEIVAGEGGANLKTAAGVSVWTPNTVENDALAEQLNELGTAAKDAVEATLADLETRATDYLTDIIGLPASFPDIATLTALDYTPEVIDTTADGIAEDHEALRKQRAYLSQLAARGHTYMPGFAVDAISEIHLQQADKRRELAVNVVKQQNSAVLSVYSAKIGSLGSALNSLTRARMAFIGAAGDYVNSVRKGVTYSIDQTFFDALTQLKYDALQVKVFNEDTGVKSRAISAFNELQNAQSAYDAGLRDYLMAKQKYVLSMRDLDYGQYISEQKVTTQTGIAMIEMLGRIAAAAEAAMNVVVSSAESSFG